MFSAALAASVLCQSCVRDVELPEEVQSDWTDIPIPPVVSMTADACA